MPLPAIPLHNYPPRSVTEGLDRGFTIENAASIDRWKNDNDPRIHVSEVKSCVRQVIMNRFFLPTTHERPIEEKMIMEVGKALHEKYQGYLKASGFLVRADFEHDKWVVGDELFVGHPDADYILIGGSEIVDFKSIREGGWQRLSSPKEADVLQVTCYMGLTGRRKGRLVYVSRDSGKRKEFAFDFNPLLWAEARSDAKAIRILLEEAFENGSLPPIPEHLQGSTPPHERGSWSEFPCWYKTKDNPDGFFCEKYGHCWEGQPLVRIPFENVKAAREQFGWTSEAEEEGPPVVSTMSRPGNAVAAQPAAAKPSPQPVSPHPGVLTP